MNSKIEINYLESTYKNKSLFMNHAIEYASRSLLSSGNYIITAKSHGPGTPAHLVLVSIEIPHLALLLKLKMTTESGYDKSKLYPNATFTSSLSMCMLQIKNFHDGTPN